MVKHDGFDFPDDLYYTPDQLWVKKEGDKVRIGFTTFGMDLAGKIKFVRLRPAGKEIEAGRSIGTLESGKWTGPVKAPVILNEDPYGKGWVAVLKPSNLDGEIKTLQGASGLDAWVKKEFAEKRPS
jgi:glycine cleavage system H protein